MPQRSAWDDLEKFFLLQDPEPMDPHAAAATLSEAADNPELRGRAAAAIILLQLQSPSPSHEAIKQAIKLIKADDMGLKEWHQIDEVFQMAVARGHRLSNVRRMFNNRCLDMIS